MFLFLFLFFLCSIDYYSRYSSNGPTNALKGHSERPQPTVSIEIGAESLYSYGQLQPSKQTTYAQDATVPDDVEEQLYERISDLDFQFESEEAQPYSEPVKLTY